uniref:Cadherin domain-containing protein n=1 Tax=Timema bartmani TaxID=61472 RepID=A0A7R9ETL1_9NEOP|nr:unnamed protein product [Timema bartmani]
MGLYAGFTLNENISPSNWGQSGHLPRIQGTAILGESKRGSEMVAIANCLLLATLGSLLAVNANVPLFDVSTSIRVLIVPYDARVGSAIYRLRGTDADFDFPLRFEVVGNAGGHIIRTVDIPCNKNHTFCEGDVVLTRPLERGRMYDVRLKVVDTTGDFTILDCTIRTSSRTTPTDTIFPHLPSLIEVAEDAVPGTELDYVIARNNPLIARHVSLELRDPYAEPRNDTRNVASFQVAVAVRDAQDMPPVFWNVPPVTMIKHTVQPGGVVLQVHDRTAMENPSYHGLFMCSCDVSPRGTWFYKCTIGPQWRTQAIMDFSCVPVIFLQGDVVLQVHAEDGDKGQPRQVRYGLVSEENPFTTFFHINDRTGEITMSRPLRELLTITRSHQPVLLTVLAEEVRMGLHEPPAMSTVVQVALLLGELGNSPPYFENDNYGSRIDENSPQGTVLVFGDPYITEIKDDDMGNSQGTILVFGDSYVTEIKDDDMGKNGVFSITLENNNGTFEISPTVGERRASFVIRVRDNQLLDYEMRQTIHFTVRAQDLDTGLFGKVHYTRILGHLNTSLRLDSITGLITVSTNSHMFDRETAPVDYTAQLYKPIPSPGTVDYTAQLAKPIPSPEFRFNVEARDMEGNGNRATVPLVIKLIDVNDETPYFEKDQYDFFLTPSLRNFTTPAIITAIDMDAEAPNNDVRYEIISGNYENNYYLHEIKGELTVRASHSRGKRTRTKRLIEDQEDVDRSSITMTARAYDLGVPHRWSTTTIHVLPPDANTRTMMFIVNGSPPDRAQTLAMLQALTGGQVRIKDIRPYERHEIQPLGASVREDTEERSMVIATILYDGTTMVDVRQLQKQLQANVKMRKVENHYGKTIISTPDRDSNLAIPVFGSLVYCESSALGHAATEVGFTRVVLKSTSEQHLLLTGVSRAENRALFWILMVLAILIVLIILLLLLCCLCPSCPLYVIPKKTSRVSSEENVQLVLKDEGPGMQTKAVQAEWMGHRREAWSADNREQQWRFNHRNNPHKNRKEYGGVDGGAILDERRGGQEVSGAAAANTLSSRGSMQEGPAIIYSRELQHLQQRYNHNREVYVEDLEGGEYHSSGQILDINQARARGRYSEDSHQFHKAKYGGREDNNTHRFKVKDRDTHGQEEPRLRHERARGRDANAEDDLDTDSMRQHEADRGSDIGKGRIQREYRGNRGEYRIVIQRTNNGDEEEQEVELVDEKEISPESRREQFFIRDGNAEILRLVTRGRSIEDQQYVHTDQVSDTRQQQRPFTLVPVQQNETQQQQQQQHVKIENGKDILMQRFIEDQRHNTEEQPPVTKAADDSHITSDNVTTTFNSVQQQDELVRRLLEEEEARLTNMRLLSEALAQHREQETQILAPVEQHETQSLPGQTTMATQTDVDTSTQTEPLYLMRPPRRRTRSDNDDSFTEGEDKEGDDDKEKDETIFSPVEGSVVPWVKRQKNKKRKHSRYRSDLKYKRLGGSFGKGCVSSLKRHKIKTPIMEETESALEAAEKSASNGKNQKTGNYSENKSSMLRQRNNKVKLVNVEVSSVKKNKREKHTDEVEEETPSDSLEERPNKKDSLQKRESHHGALTESTIDGSRYEVTNLTVRSSREKIRRSQSRGRDDLSSPADRSRIRDPSSHQESPKISIKHSRNYQKIRHESLDRKDFRDGVKFHDSPRRRSRDGSRKRESNFGDTIDHRRSRYDVEFEDGSDIEVKRGSREREDSHDRYNEELAEKSSGSRVIKQSRQKGLVQNEIYDKYTFQRGEYVENSPNRKIKQPFQQRYFSQDDTYENKTESRDLRNQENTENRVRQRSNERDYSRNYDYEEENSHYEPIFQETPERRMRKQSTRAQLTPEESPERGTARGGDSNNNTRDQFTCEYSSERRYAHVENESRSQKKRSRRQGSPERRNALDEDSLRSPENRAFGKTTRKYSPEEINERGEDSIRGSTKKRAISQSIRKDSSQTSNSRDDKSPKRSQERRMHGNPIIEDNLDRRTILDENSFKERTEQIVKNRSTTKYSTVEDSLEREISHRGVSYPDDSERMPKERFNKKGSKSNVNTGYNRKDLKNYSESPEINESDDPVQKNDARQYSVDKKSLSLERKNEHSNQTHSYRYEHSDNASLNVSSERRSNEYSSQRQSSQREPSPAFTNDSLEQPTNTETSREVKREQTRQNKSPSPQVEIKVPKKADKKATLAANISSRRPSALSSKEVERRKRDRQSLSEPDHNQKLVPQKQFDERVRAKSMTQMNDQPEAPLTRRHTSLPTKGNRENSKTSSRYMGWYKNKKEEKERQKREEDEKKREEEKKLEDNRLKAMRVMKNVVKLEKDFKHKGSGIEVEVTAEDDIGKEGKRVSEEKVGEFHILKVSGFEDDLDSGIAMSSLTAPGVCMKKKNQQLLEKKSVFTIAYDDVQTKQLRPDSTSPQY